MIIMSWLTDIFSGTVGGVLKNVSSAVDELHLSAEEKENLKLNFEKILQQRESVLNFTIQTELKAKEQILIAELKQDDNYTKRARPTVVYSGLFFIGYIYCLVPVLSHLLKLNIPTLNLPSEFWLGWSGIVATWSVGRSMEKMGAANKFSNKITGGVKSHLLGDE